MKFYYNPKIGGMDIKKDERPSEDEVLRKVMRVFARKKPSEKEVRDIIKKVQTGTRNANYLIKSPEMKEICYFILRELA